MRGIDLVGKQFGRLTVLRQDGRDKWGQILWLSKCLCGAHISPTGGDLRTGNTKSCGCLQAENRIKHGLSATPEYRAWIGAKSRCYNKKKKRYKYWGGRGIRMCDQWLNSFDEFFKHMGRRPEGTSLDRIDNDGNYEPGNCRWADRVTQNTNKRQRGPNENYNVAL